MSNVAFVAGADAPGSSRFAPPSTWNPRDPGGSFEYWRRARNTLEVRAWNVLLAGSVVLCAANAAALPGVTITSPSSGATVFGSKVTVQATITVPDYSTTSAFAALATVGSGMSRVGTSTYSVDLVTTYVADGPTRVEVRATDPTGTATASIPVNFDAPPVVALTGPGSVIAHPTEPTIRVQGTCTDGSKTCSTLQALLGGSVVGMGTTSVDSTVTLSASYPERNGLTLVGSDSLGQKSSAPAREIFALFDGTKVIFSGQEGSWSDFDGTRLLFWNGTKLVVRNVATKVDTVAASTNGGFLSPTGVVYSTGGGAYHWTPTGTSTLFTSTAATLQKVSGHYALFSEAIPNPPYPSYDVLRLYDLNTGTQVYRSPAPGGGLQSFACTDLAANGTLIFHVMLSSAGNINVWKSGTTTYLAGGGVPLGCTTDGVNNAYGYGGAASSTAVYATVTGCSSGGTWLCPYAAAMANGWTAYVYAPSGLGRPAKGDTIRRAPDGTLEILGVTDFTGDRVPHAIDPAGNVVYRLSGNWSLHHVGGVIDTLSPAVAQRVFYVAGKWYGRVGEGLVEMRGATGSSDAGVDASPTDTATSDTSVGDSAPIDSTIADTSVVDSMGADSLVIDSTIADTSVVDSATPIDSAVADTFVSADTSWDAPVEDAPRACTADGKSTIHRDGSIASCEPYRCSLATLECLDRCNVSDDCALPFVCDPVAHTCHTPSAAPAPDEPSGCAHGRGSTPTLLTSSSRSAGGSAMGLTLLAIVAMRRRRVSRPLTQPAASTATRSPTAGTTGSRPRAATGTCGCGGTTSIARS